MIFLFTDFGAADLYVGQVKAVLAQAAPGIAVIDLLNNAPRFQILPGAHLLAALAGYLPPDSTTLAVVDPGVGTERKPIVLRCHGRWFVGPDNGLLSVLAARSECDIWEIVWRPDALSRSFHGRDLFAPIAARIAAGTSSGGDLQPCPALQARFDGEDLWQAIYIDHYGNVFTGIRGSSLEATAALKIAGENVRHAGVFAEAADGHPFWYVNSIGLVEVACFRTSAAERLRIGIGGNVGLSAS